MTMKRLLSRNRRRRRNAKPPGPFLLGAFGGLRDSLLAATRDTLHTCFEGITVKKIVEVVEVEGEGLESLLGQNVLLLCLNYFYAGKLIGVNDSFVRLENPQIVYETGAWANKSYTDAQPMHATTWNIQRSAIESWGIGK